VNIDNLINGRKYVGLNIQQIYNFLAGYKTILQIFFQIIFFCSFLPLTAATERITPNMIPKKAANKT
jgi:hypothetical protein